MVNNKGATVHDFPFFIVLLFLFLVIAGAFATGTTLLFGKGYDARQADADTLSYKVSNCINNNEIDFSNLDLFYKTCSLDKDALQLFMLKICKGDLGSSDCVDNEVKGLVTIGSNFPSCRFQGKNDKYPRCALTSLKKGNEIYWIVAGSNQISRRING